MLHLSRNLVHRFLAHTLFLRHIQVPENLGAAPLFRLLISAGIVTVLTVVMLSDIVASNRQQSLPAVSESRRAAVEKDDTVRERQRTAAPASRSITEKKAAGNEMLEMQVSGDEPAAEASVVIYEEESEPRLDADKKEMPVERVPDDEMSGMTGAVAEEVSLETARDAKQAGLQQIDNIMAQELDKIIALKEAGDDSWRAELQAFKQRYPDYPIPPDLEP